MQILIDKVRIYNFRALKKCIVNLSPITLLIGANNSGKTSLLRALHIALGVGAKRISTEDFFIGSGVVKTKDKEIIIDIHIIPIDTEGKRVDSFDNIWREKQFGELINFDSEDKQYFSFRAKVMYDLLKGDYAIKRYKINDWTDNDNWETIEYKEELRQYFDSFPLFFIDAQRDIISDLRDRTSDEKNYREALDNIQNSLRNSTLENEEKLALYNEIELAKESWKKYCSTVSSNAISVQGFLRNIALGMVNLSHMKEKGITLATVHSSKGLEYDIVFIIGLNKGSFPDYRAVKAGGKALEEEKNETYVAITRAKRFLHLSYPKNKFMPWNNEKPYPQKVSPFLESIWEHYDISAS